MKNDSRLLQFYIFFSGKNDFSLVEVLIELHVTFNATLLHP